MTLQPIPRATESKRRSATSLDAHSLESDDTRVQCGDAYFQRTERSASPTLNRRGFVSAAGTFAALAPALSLAAADSAAPEADRLRVAAIGHTGRGGFGHGLSTTWLNVSETVIVAVADVDQEGLKREQQRTRAKHAFSDYREMIKQIRPDIVAVCARHVDQHHEMIMAAIEGGAQGIYCEKPFCRTLEEADAIVAACERSGTKLALAHRNRYHPALVATQAAIKAGAIGKPLEIRCRGKEDARGGCQDLWVLGTHLFNLVPVFAGNVTACSAVMMKGHELVTPSDIVQGNEGNGPIAGDRLHARYETESGMPVYFDSIRNHGVGAAGFGLQLIGTEGIVDLRMDSEPIAHFIPANPFQPASKPRPWIPISSAGIGKTEPIPDIVNQVAHHILAVRDLLAAINEDRPPLCSDVDGRATLEMVHGAYASHVEGGKVVQLPLAKRTHPFTNWQDNAS
ncbi:1,5-anhydro-D-fructose reductase [Novipirellula galeiformis]|uniref:1,5-anhydro-D-fructose reductase n=1 Tax=Novipirellula galeiformis TaxID=2528004 RepID=A0A5C6CPA6_9BACT|nr:Gfo/Idh/MocA family oxidoreductase [Novipirellula galeiformis]TWU25437.1 1,5-anhydro-D-fructose reductase [Novipirellula galeiformis]